MKTKKLSKKLYFNKRTVATLNDDEMKTLRGGGDDETTTSNSSSSVPCVPLTSSKDPVIHTI